MLAPVRRTGSSRAALVVFAVLALLAGCATAARDGLPTGDPPPGFPVTITNCGMTTTYQRPPQRAVTMNQHATEIMLALGLEERMVGTAWLDDRILLRYREEYRQVPVLSEEYPSFEVLLQANPDFVFGGFASAFSKQEGRSRQRLAEAGIKTHLNPAACADGPVTMQLLWRELRTIATIFDVEQRAEALIADLQAMLDRTAARVDGVQPVSVFVYDSGTKSPYTAGGHGILNEIIRRAGGRNVFAGLNDGFVTVSWEQVIRRSPERILILNYGDTSVARKKQFLLTNPVLSRIPAIRHRRFAVLPLSATVLGIRAPRAVGRLARQLHPGRFG